MGVRGQHQAPAAFPPGLGGPHGRSGRVRKISSHTGIRSSDRSARSESLYRLSYPGRHILEKGSYINPFHTYILKCW